jgi:hypothetical protein
MSLCRLPWHADAAMCPPSGELAPQAILTPGMGIGGHNSPESADAMLSQPPAPGATDLRENQPSKSNRKLLATWLFRVSDVVLMGVIGVALFPRKGGLVVSASGPRKTQVDDLAIFIDGHQVCNASPCAVRELRLGVDHEIRVKAPGYVEPSARAVRPRAGPDAIVAMELSPSYGSLEVFSEQSGLALWVDGAEKGPLPRLLDALAAGEHTIRVAGNDRYAPYEERVTIRGGLHVVVGPVKPWVSRGLVMLKPGANSEGAKVVLVCNGKERAVPQLPTKLDVSNLVPWAVVATKPGYNTYDEELGFDYGNYEKTLTVALTPKSKK